MKNQNSLKAFKTINKESIRRKVYLIIKDAHEQNNSVSCKDIEHILNLKHETVSPRLTELMQMQVIKVSHSVTNNSNLKEAAYTLRKDSDPLNVFKPSNKELLKYAKTLMSEDQLKRLKRYESGEVEINLNNKL